MLGRTVAELRASMTPLEYQQWKVYAKWKAAGCPHV